MRYLFTIFVFFSLSSFGQIVVNEYSAANFDDFNDNYGQNEDWFELYNNSEKIYKHGSCFSWFSIFTSFRS